MFCGAVNGTATAALLPLSVVLIVWGIRRGAAPWSLLGWWAGSRGDLSSGGRRRCSKLNAYSPPFFDYVEDAKTTTGSHRLRRRRCAGSATGSTTSTSATTRPGPAGFAYALEPLAGRGAALLAAVGCSGWSRWREPLAGAAGALGGVGLVCLTVGARVGRARARWPRRVQDLLDGPFALLRNVHKIDPVLRLPLAIGVGAAFAARRWRARRRGTWWRQGSGVVR